MALSFRSGVLRIPPQLLVVAAALAFSPQRAFGQELAPKVDPKDLGLVVPAGEPQPGGDRRVLVRSAPGEATVANVHLEIGDHFIVLLPDGQLSSLPQQACDATDKAFQPATKEEIISSLVKERFIGFKTRTTNHYVFVYNTSQEFCEGTSRILETMYPGVVSYCQRQGLNVRVPDYPLVVIMFRTEAEFTQYSNVGNSIAAYYNELDNHVVLYEQSQLAKVAPAIAVKQAISTVAHEGVHQILHNIGVQQRLSSWPMWIGEGLPEFFAPTSVANRARWAGIGKVNQLRLHALSEQFKGQRLASDGSWMRQTVAARELDANGYAAAWALTDFLAKKRKTEFFAYLREVSQSAPLQAPMESAPLFEKHFGLDYAALENEVLKHLKTMPYVDPVANQPHYLGVIDTPFERLAVISASPAYIRQWRTKTLAALPAPTRMKATSVVRVFSNRALAERGLSIALSR